MKRIAAVLCFCALACVGISAVPEVAVGAVPEASVVSAKLVEYSESLTANATLSYMGQSEVTSAMPLVISRYCVSAGEHIEAGDIIAVVDKDGSRTFVESLGQLPQLAVAASGISTAVSLIPEFITADRSGTVLSTAGNGAAVEAGSSLCTIAGTDTLILTAPISEQYISSVSVGQTAVFSMTAYPDEVFTGKVAAVAATARNCYSGSVLETVVDITITPDEYDERMKSGLTAEVKLSLSEPETICVLSYEAIGQDEGGEFVYVYEDGKAVRRKVFTGAEFSDGTQIIKGVAADELVFTSPDKISGCSYIRCGMEEE